MSVLRNELAQKSIDCVELETKVANANEQREEYKQKFENIKKDMIALKRQIDKEKEMQLTKQAEELEMIKKQMRNQSQADAEKKELNGLRLHLASLTEKLSES